MNNIIKVTNLIIKDDGEILLIKEWSKKKRGYFWNIIKGTFSNENDGSFLEALERETKEEVNLPCEVIGLIGIFQGIENGDFLVHVNFLSKPKNTIRPTLPTEFGPDEEIIDYKWVSKEEFEEMGMDEFMSDKVKLIVDQWHAEKVTYPLSCLKVLSES